MWGIAHKPTYPLQAGALSAMGAVLLVAGPRETWAPNGLAFSLLGVGGSGSGGGG